MRRNALILTTIVFLMFLFGCSSKDKANSNSFQTKSRIDEHIIKTEITAQGLILPQVTADDTVKSVVSRISYDTAFFVSDKVGNNLLGTEDIRKNDMLETVRKVKDIFDETYKIVEYPEKVKNWIVASGSSVVMQDRYRYEWLCAEGTNGLYTVYLTKLDCKTGTMEIEDKAMQTSPFIYLCKLNNREFISYSNYQVKSDTTPYAVVSALAVYNIDGSKKEILNVKYENSESWKNSRGMLIERFFCDGGEIYGLVHGRNNNKEFYKLCSFDNEGKIRTEKELIGLDKVIGTTYPIVMEKRGSYLAFRMYDGLRNCICRIDSEGAVRIIMEESDTANCKFAIVDDYIFFSESNVDPNTDAVIKRPCPVYAINTKEEEIKKIEIDIPLNKAYFAQIDSISNGSLMLTYCEDGVYNVQKVFQFELSKDEINRIFQ